MREELYKFVASLQKTVPFGKIQNSDEQIFTRNFVRAGNTIQSAELNITSLPSNVEGLTRLLVDGLAFFGEDSELGPNIGVLEHILVSDEVPSTFTYFETGHHLRLRFINQSQIMLEENADLGVHGLGVNFSGMYIGGKSQPSENEV